MSEILSENGPMSCGNIMFANVPFSWKRVKDKRNYSSSWEKTVPRCQGHRETRKADNATNNPWRLGPVAESLIGSWDWTEVSKNQGKSFLNNKSELLLWLWDHAPVHFSMQRTASLCPDEKFLEEQQQAIPACHEMQQYSISTGPRGSTPKSCVNQAKSK